MAEKFHERFDIEVGSGEAKRRFVNRLHGIIFQQFLNSIPERDRYRIRDYVIQQIGEKPKRGRGLATQVGDNFDDNLSAVEALYNALHSMASQYNSHVAYKSYSYDYYREQLAALINHILKQSEVDLGISWQQGHFHRTGAALLGNRLVNDPLHWLSSPQYKTVLIPFRKALEDFQHSPQRPSLLSDVITDMYEALEALSKIITNRPDKDLSANRELFLTKIKASNEYKKLLRDYIDYANRFRHAARDGQSKPELSPTEVESCIYLTGVFIRLAMPSAR